MTEPDRASLRTAFTEVPALYDRVRPRYPAQLFDDLAGMCAVGPGCRVLEIGCGTGQATVALAERGFRVVALDLGAGMVALARTRLARFPQVEVITAAFEDWSLPAAPFDVVFAATAFHWIDPAVRVRRSAAALRPGGALATITTHHVAGGSEEFFAEVQAYYERARPGWGQAGPPPVAPVPSDGELEEAGCFEPARSLRYEAELSYTSSEYLDLLATYSDHRRLEPAALTELLARIGRLIDERFGGRIRKRYLWELRVARRR